MGRFAIGGKRVGHVVLTLILLAGVHTGRPEVVGRLLRREKPVVNRCFRLFGRWWIGLGGEGKMDTFGAAGSVL